MTKPVLTHKRRYAINALATVSLFAAAGCFEKGDEDEDDGDAGDGGGGGSIVDLWGLDSLTYSYGGETYTYDYPQSYSYEGYSYTFGIRMDIQNPTTGEWYSYYEYSYGGESYSYIEEGYAVTVTETGTATYQIQLEDALIMDCTLAGNSLSCDGVSEETEAMTFELDWVRL